MTESLIDRFEELVGKRDADMYKKEYNSIKKQIEEALEKAKKYDKLFNLKSKSIFCARCERFLGNYKPEPIELCYHCKEIFGEKVNKK